MADVAVEWAEGRQRFAAGLRRERGSRSYRIFAAQTGLDLKSLWEWETGQRLPYKDTAERVAKAVGVPLAKLVAR